MTDNGLHDCTAAINAALLLQQGVECDEPWRVLLAILDSFERVSAEQAVHLLDQLEEFPSLLLIAQRLARRATERFPDLGPAWFRLGYIQLLGDRQSPDAYLALERAWAIDPEARPKIALCLSAAYLAVRRWSDAERTCRYAVEWQPENADAYSNLSIALRQQYQTDAAIEAARQALRIDPAHPHAPLNLALALVDSGRYGPAQALLREGLAAAPTDDRLRLPLAELELRLGQWDTGWANMHARFSLPGLREQLVAREQTCGVPYWRGETLAGKTLGIWLEQGYGDAILLIRYLPLFAQRVREQGGTLVFGCFGPLVELFRPLIPEDVELDVDRLRPTDYHLPLMSGCAAFGVTEHGLPGKPYLAAVPERVEQWRSQLADDGRLHVALAWTGNPQQVRNEVRSLDPLALKALLATENVLFHSVNPAASAEVRELAALGLPIVDQSAALESFADTAALLGAVDVVLSCCTSTAHLAGAIGAPTFLMLDKVGSYLWGTDDDRSPWYDSLRILRQESLGDWTTVIGRAREHLQRAHSVRRQ